MAFIVLRRSRNTQSYYLVESYRDDEGKAKRRTFCYLGSEQDGTDTLAKPLAHWEQLMNRAKGELRKARGEQRQMIRRRIEATAALIGVITEPMQFRVRLKPSAAGESSGPKKRSTGRALSRYATTPPRKTPRLRKGRFCSWRNGTTPTRAAIITPSCDSRIRMTGRWLFGSATSRSSACVTLLRFARPDQLHDRFPDLRCRPCHAATKSITASSVQTLCNHWHPCSTQEACGKTSCGSRDADAIPAASTISYLRFVARGYFIGLVSPSD